MPPDPQAREEKMVMTAPTEAMVYPVIRAYPVLRARWVTQARQDQKERWALKAPRDRQDRPRQQGSPLSCTQR